MENEDKVFIVFTGTPQVFTDLTPAEEYAAEKCELYHEDHTVMVVPRSSVRHGIVARYKGVVLCTLEEAARTDE